MIKRGLLVESTTISRARSNAKQKVPDGMLLSNEIIFSDGSEITIKITDSSVDKALEQVSSEIPKGSKILRENIVFEASRANIEIQAFAENEAKNKILREKPQSLQIEKISLVREGSKGFLRIGRKANIYRLELYQPALVEITYKPKAKLAYDLVEPWENGLIWRGINPDEIDLLLKLRMPGHPEVKALYAEGALKKYGVDAVEPVLSAILSNFRNEKALVGMVGALVRLGVQGGTALNTIVKNGEFELKKKLMEALIKIERPGCVSVLLELSKDKDSTLKYQSAYGVILLGHKFQDVEIVTKGTNRLLTLMKSKDSLVSSSSYSCLVNNWKMENVKPTQHVKIFTTISKVPVRISRFEKVKKIAKVLLNSKILSESQNEKVSTALQSGEKISKQYEDEYDPSEFNRAMNEAYGLNDQNW
jgi:hypothetical protein